MFPEASKKDQDKYIEIMQNEIKRSLTIMNDFSSLSKIKNIGREISDSYGFRGNSNFNHHDR